MSRLMAEFVMSFNDFRIFFGAAIILDPNTFELSNLSYIFTCILMFDNIVIDVKLLDHA